MYARSMVVCVLGREEALALLESYREHFVALDDHGFVDSIDPEVLIDSPDVLVYDGDYEVDALHLEAHTPSVIVMGNLRVRDLLRQDFQAGALTVFGDLHAGAIATEGEIFAGGNIVADQLAYGCSPTRGTKSLGRMQTPWLIADRGYVFAPAGGSMPACSSTSKVASTSASNSAVRCAPVRLGRYFGAEVRERAQFGGVAALCAKLSAGLALLPDGWSAPAKARSAKAKASSRKKKNKKTPKRTAKKKALLKPKKAPSAKPKTKTRAGKGVK